MFDILWICLTYCIGSVPFGLVFAKTFCRIDPRTAGSGNVGATNVARLCGKAWGAATLACDLLKGTIPVFIAMQYSTSELVWTLTALAAILGLILTGISIPASSASRAARRWRPPLVSLSLWRSGSSSSPSAFACS